jgi:hypothetical protein
MNEAALRRLEEVRNERWEQRCSQLEEFLYKHGHPPTRAHYLTHRKLITWLRQQQKSAAAGKMRSDRWWRLTGLGLELLTKEERWERRYLQLREYRRRFGHCRVPAKWREDVAFGHWVHVQRAFKKKGLLSAERIARLEAIGFEWSHPRKAVSPGAQWEEMFSHLERFREEHGHTEVPRGFDGVPGLRRWVLRQRELRKKESLGSERCERLEAIGFAWQSVRQARNLRELWETRFQQLLQYRQRFGHCRVPAKWREDLPLGHWVHVQREFKKRGILSAERVQRLEAIGFQWHGKFTRSYRHDDQWAQMLAHLLEYQKQHGDTQVPPSYRPHGLGSWVANHRVAERKGELRPDRREQLDAMGFEWRGMRKAGQQRWERRFEQLLSFQQRFGHCQVPMHWREDPAFGHWVDNQRAFRKAGKLSSERVRRLDEIGFQWRR